MGGIGGGDLKLGEGGGVGVWYKGCGIGRVGKRERCDGKVVVGGKNRIEKMRVWGSDGEKL